ncbi:hypothetical protein DWU89_18770, partial [Parabacteroides acidifaciens]
IVRKGSLNREKSQSKMDQDFGRNRKTVKNRGYCNLSGLQKIQNLTDLKQIRFHAHGNRIAWAWNFEWMGMETSIKIISFFARFETINDDLSVRRYVCITGRRFRRRRRRTQIIYCFKRK